MKNDFNLILNEVKQFAAQRRIAVPTEYLDEMEMTALKDAANYANNIISITELLFEELYDANDIPALNVVYSNTLESLTTLYMLQHSLHTAISIKEITG